MIKCELLVIIPTYNEEGRLKESFFLEYLKSKKNISLLFVNDGSTDGTLSILKVLKSKHCSINFLSIEKNIGKGNAIRQAVLWAKKEYEFNFFGFIDSDLAIPLKYIDILYESAKNTDFNVLTVSRYKDLPLFEANNKSSFSRKIISYISRSITNVLFKKIVSDTQCGCKIFDKDLLEVAFDKPFISAWLFDIEIFLRLKKTNNLNLIEHQIDRLNDNFGSRLEKKDLIKIGKELFQIVLTY